MMAPTGRNIKRELLIGALYILLFATGYLLGRAESTQHAQNECMAECNEFIAQQYGSQPAARLFNFTPPGSCLPNVTAAERPECFG
jgi:hypothetical protein